MSDTTRFSLDSLAIETRPVLRLPPRVLHNFLGRLLRPGEISLLHGPERAPLSLLAHWISIHATSRKHPVAYLDSANNFSPVTVRSMLADEKKVNAVLKLVGVGHPLTLSDLERLVKRAASMEGLRLIVVDSLTGLLNLSGTPGTAERQRMLFRSMDSVRQLLVSSDTHLMMTDHSSAWSSQSAPLGGLVLAHAVDSIVRVIRLPETKEIFRLVIERSSAPSDFGGIVIRINHRGVMSVKRGGV
ncbi:MAG: hypothetical protein K9W43_04590 [Candidatus Thorarchaeota archaeon]|nr:hypothetical protein [Candidatus Thorarchaeota archaeon]